MKLYLDTSVPSFLLASDSPDKQEVTKMFFKTIGADPKYKVFISELILDEINKTLEAEKRSFLLKTVEKYPMLEVNDECFTLASRYLEEKILTKDSFEDALHIAAASVYKLDILVSWNFRHIVSLKTKRGVTGVNTLLGYKAPDIISPQELL